MNPKSLVLTLRKIFGLFPSSFRSGTPAHPTPGDLVRHMVAELVTSGRWEWVTFETKPFKDFVEVALEDDKLIINVAYRFPEHYETLFPRLGLSIPDGWRVVEFKQGPSMLLATGIHDQERVVDFIDRAFPALYDTGRVYRLVGHYR